MKKYILMAVLIIAVSIGAKAQFSLGIKGGVNYSHINADNFKPSNVTGYEAGLFARIGGPIYLQPELYLNSTGGEFNSNNTYNGKVTFTNLNVPILVGFRFGPKNLNLRIMAGPVYTNTLNTNESFSNNFNTAFNNFGNYKSNNWGYQAGTGVDLGPITADFRYEGGLNDINSNYGQRQKIYALSIGYKLF